MKKLQEYIADAESRKVAIGHFNISNIEGLWAVFRSAQKLNVPVIIGVSEGEREFIGVTQAVALIKSIREEYDYPIFLNADHTYSFEKVKEAIDNNFDAVIYDGAKLPFEENVKIAKQCVEYARSKNSDILVESELGYIGTSSKILDAIPEGASISGDSLTSPEQAKKFVDETGINLFAPAVGNVHGMLRNVHNPRLDIERIKAIRLAANRPLVLHGGSGIEDQDFVDAINAGIAIVHISTEIRIAYKNALVDSLLKNRDEVAPYRILAPAVAAMSTIVENRLKLFNGIK